MKRRTTAAAVLLLTLGLSASMPAAPVPAAGLSAVDTAAKPGPHVSLKRLASYSTGAALAESGAEIVHYDRQSERAYLINGDTRAFEIVDLSGLAAGKEGQELTASHKFPIGDYSPSAQPDLFGDITSLALHPTKDLVAVSVPNSVKTEPGSVVFFRKNGEYLGYLPVGALPDMLTFTPDGQTLLVANEGEPDDDDAALDPDGSVSIIRLGNNETDLQSFQTLTARFDQPGLPIDAQVRYASLKTGAVPNPTPQQWAADLEPEFITVSEDGRTAYVSLQENNAIAVLDVASGHFTGVYGLGFKNHLLPANKLDVSDKDKTAKLDNYPVLGAYMPDGISLRTIGGKPYLFTANEGDGREWGGLSDEVKFSDLYTAAGPAPDVQVKLDARYYPGTSQAELDAIDLKQLSAANQMGNLRLTNSVSSAVYRDTVTGVTYYPALVAYGARSFSIWDVEKLGQPGQQVYDSGSQFEQIIAGSYPALFNSDHEENKLDNRSDNKGPEPEYIEVGEAFGKTYAFIGLERQSGIMVYDVSDPQAPRFETYFNLRDLKHSGQGDLGPEGLDFIPAADSPTGRPILLVGNEVSGTMSVLELNQAAPFTVQPAEDESVYTISQDQGIPSMTVKPDVTGLKTFKANIRAELGHEGKETAVFRHRRGAETVGIAAVRGDFDSGELLPEAQFNVRPGDVVEVFLVDELTNDPAKQPVVLQ